MELRTGILGLLFVGIILTTDHVTATDNDTVATCSSDPTLHCDVGIQQTGCLDTTVDSWNAVNAGPGAPSNPELWAYFKYFKYKGQDYCMPTLNMTWKLPTSLSAMYVRGFTLDVLYTGDSFGKQYCAHLDVSQDADRFKNASYADQLVFSYDMFGPLSGAAITIFLQSVPLPPPDQQHKCHAWSVSLPETLECGDVCDRYGGLPQKIPITSVTSDKPCSLVHGSQINTIPVFSCPHKSTPPTVITPKPTPTPTSQTTHTLSEPANHSKGMNLSTTILLVAIGGCVAMFAVIMVCVTIIQARKQKGDALYRGHKSVSNHGDDPGDDNLGLDEDQQPTFDARLVPEFKTVPPANVSDITDNTGRLMTFNRDYEDACPSEIIHEGSTEGYLHQPEGLDSGIQDDLQTVSFDDAELDEFAKKRAARPDLGGVRV